MDADRAPDYHLKNRKKIAAVLARKAFLRISKNDRKRAPTVDVNAKFEINII